MKDACKHTDFACMPTSELAAIVVTDHLGLKVREKALEEFGKRLAREEKDFLAFMNGLVMIKENAMFKRRADLLMDLLNERMRSTRAAS